VGHGLYDPAYEHDACGVGLICSLKGQRSHDIVHKALQILINLTHRGACGCDPESGDGAGILLQIPDAFFRRECKRLKISLPDPKEYGTGLVFLPRREADRSACMQWFRDVVEEEGQVFLGWREVPVRSELVGPVARASEPAIRQIFIGRGKGGGSARDFERKLYVIRKVIEHKVRLSELPERDMFYVPSLSCSTFNYKGMILPERMETYFPDLADPDLGSGFALVHQRYSTNTFPRWSLAQPFRFLCHNGEINTLRGNMNWMNARQGLFRSNLFGPDMAKLFPILTEGASDSAQLDSAIELLYHTGRSLPHAIMMLIPEAWQNHPTMSDAKRAFYEYHSCLMEPWDGPASIPFADGTCCGAVLDRNGLRPSRYTVTKDGLVIMGSETGVIDISPRNVLSKGRLEPGRMFLVNMEEGRIVDDEEIKAGMASRQPYREWVDSNLITLDRYPDPQAPVTVERGDLVRLQQLNGYTLEDLNVILAPMAEKGQEPTGSMGTDTPLAVLSDRPQLLYNYFHQLFAQVTNPPLDAIREELVTSMKTTLGAECDLFDETPEHCQQLSLDQPILTNINLEKIRRLDVPYLKSATLPIVFPVAEGGRGLEAALDALCRQASEEVESGATILILSDRNVSRELAPIPSLLAVAAVHHHLIRELERTRCGLILESGEPREVHHFALLCGYGCAAINPHLAYASIYDMARRRVLAEDVSYETAQLEYIHAIQKGLLKIMSKMGISTLHSYRGAQIFEAVGISSSVIDRYFPGTASRVEGIGLDEIAEEVRLRHAQAYPTRAIAESLELDVGGQYQWRRGGEEHLLNPQAIAKLQQAVRENSEACYGEFARLINEETRYQCTLRSLMEFAPARPPVPLDEVEPWTAIVRRFKTGAMSYGSISQEAHETLAIAMNRLGGKSNSGEGGEDPERFLPNPDGSWRRSAIKQVASGRFGVTSNYLANADELQIKMAQGAKPGEGGQLPGFKVYPWIARTRHSTPYVTLISPPPHHDIYSIEDLAQLIHDLKCANPRARISVKLVSEVGVGTVAAGVAKGKAEVVLISGYEGGTGASPQTSIKHAGLPWELGLSETQQTLVRNDLRSRIHVECDGKLLTGRDVAIACLLGAEEFGFSAGPIISIGCIMMRVCHLNTCPVGVATQDPELRKKFTGKPEHVVNFFHFVAEDLRRIMASLGFRTIDEMVGQVDCLRRKERIDHWKARKLDLRRILWKEPAPEGSTLYCSKSQDHGLAAALDHELLKLAAPALNARKPVEFPLQVRNTDRTVGAMLSYHLSRRYGEEGLPEGTIRIHATGSCGQSFMAFGARGITVDILGDANDYFGKGLSGARLIIAPPENANIVPEKNTLIGNVAFYGATAGEAYIRGLAGERFCVRNSGVRAVVEGVGDHGCEYMTGGRVVVLGPTGRNFAAGMSGGVAYVYDEKGDFRTILCNKEMVDLERVTDPQDVSELRRMIESHWRMTGSSLARQILDAFTARLPRFVKVMPIDYKRALEILEPEKAQQLAETSL
jgi:glutamate synthase domain-containing protein 2/glutamate synthase domain-containing protein 1/glutamate synthase domain-containing protein 3